MEEDQKSKLKVVISLLPFLDDLIKFLVAWSLIPLKLCMLWFICILWKQILLIHD